MSYGRPIPGAEPFRRPSPAPSEPQIVLNSEKSEKSVSASQWMGYGASYASRASSSSSQCSAAHAHAAAIGSSMLRPRGVSAYSTRNSGAACTVRDTSPSRSRPRSDCVSTFGVTRCSGTRSSEKRCGPYSRQRRTRAAHLSPKRNGKSEEGHSSSNMSGGSGWGLIVVSCIASGASGTQEVTALTDTFRSIDSPGGIPKMSKIVIFGAGGRAGRQAVAEARRRRHEVTAVVRDLSRHNGLADSGARVAAGDVTDVADVAALAAGHDAAIHAAAVYGAGTDPDAFFNGAAHALVNGLRQAGVDRLVAVGLSA